MRIGECLKRVRPLMRERLPDDLRDFNWEASFLAKLWFGNHDLHYEITPRERAGAIEIGLHFEADPLTNARLLAAFDANAKAVRRALADARIEQWDRGWCRVWESLPYRTPDAELSKELASRLAAYVTALEPILRRELPSDVAWSEPEARPTHARAAAKSRVPRATSR
ncbi:MAG TPA: hypothetical protein VJ726_05060 [Candidatus Limnocylindria bacterium]|nr:hypothetical protein [Candidatus Limnocylindria bacterium]